MAFDLTLLKKDAKVNAKREIEFDGLELTLQIQASEAFKRAAAEVQKIANTPKKVTKDSLKRGNQDEIGEYEAMLFILGEYCISQWNVTADGEPLAINGDNFLILLDQGFEKDKLTQFITLLFETYASLSQEFEDNKAKLVKKSMTATNGKKSG